MFVKKIEWKYFFTHLGLAFQSLFFTAKNRIVETMHPVMSKNIHN